MRLNFSGVDEDEIREGIRRLGEIVREQVAMYGTLTGQPTTLGVALPGGDAGQFTRASARPARAGDGDLAKVLRAAAQARRMNALTVAVLKGGRSLERQVSLKSGARVQDALARLGHRRHLDRRRRGSASRA